MSLAGKVVIVTGGASGLGAATAAMIVARGAHAAILDIDADAGSARAADLGSAASFHHADVTDAGQVERVIAGVRRTQGAVHGAVCAAGVASTGRVLGRDGLMPLQQFERVVAINLIGSFNVVRVAVAHMADSAPAASGERGVIVMTASIAAFEGQVGQAAYAASKGGIVSMTLPLARELAGIGIRVMTIAPGVFDTPLLATLPDTVRASLAAQVPCPPRFGRPDEFAALVEHIFENQMLNGETIRLDGATRMAPR